jgi:hypothetical protein
MSRQPSVVLQRPSPVPIITQPKQSVERQPFPKITPSVPDERQALRAEFQRQIYLLQTACRQQMFMLQMEFRQSMFAWQQQLLRSLLIAQQQAQPQKIHIENFNFMPKITSKNC